MSVKRSRIGLLGHGDTLSGYGSAAISTIEMWLSDAVDMAIQISEGMSVNTSGHSCQDMVDVGTRCCRDARIRLFGPEQKAHHSNQGFHQARA